MFEAMSGRVLRTIPIGVDSQDGARPNVVAVDDAAGRLFGSNGSLGGTLSSYADTRARSSMVTVPVVGAGGRSRDSQDQGSQRRSQVRSQRLLSEPAGMP
jgi:hypothetical protein